MFKAYDRKIHETLSASADGTDWKKILKNHREMIKTIQHERLIHLLVMIFTGTVMSLSFFFTILIQMPALILLDVILFGLFIGYVLHYRYLENTTQSWYRLRDRIKEKLG